MESQEIIFPLIPPSDFRYRQMCRHIGKSVLAGELVSSIGRIMSLDQGRAYQQARLHVRLLV